MKRIAITDEDGDPSGWFDEHRAKSWEERQFHDGRNMISQATLSQWEHERLYRTAKGAWILNRWSQWQGSRESYERITPASAARWLVQNGYEPPDDLAVNVEQQEV